VSRTPLLCSYPVGYRGSCPPTHRPHSALPVGAGRLAFITLLGGADREARSGGMAGQNGTAITPTGKDRIAVYGAKTVLFGALLVLSGCTREEATASLRGNLQVDEFEIIHARFPCRSPDMHFFGYRFRIGLKGEYAFGDICWDASSQKRTWQTLPNYPLSRLNIRK